MTYITNVPRKVLDEVEHITGTLPGKVYYSADGEALILADEDKYIIRVTPSATAFNNGNPTTESAYLSTLPVASLVSVQEDTYTVDHLGDLEGWSTGWEC